MEHNARGQCQPLRITCCSVGMARTVTLSTIGVAVTTTVTERNAHKTCLLCATILMLVLVVWTTVAETIVRSTGGKDHVSMKKLKAITSKRLGFVGVVHNIGTQERYGIAVRDTPLRKDVRPCATPRTGVVHTTGWKENTKSAAFSKAATPAMETAAALAMLGRGPVIVKQIQSILQTILQAILQTILQTILRAQRSRQATLQAIPQPIPQPIPHPILRQAIRQPLLQALLQALLQPILQPILQAIPLLQMMRIGTVGIRMLVVGEAFASVRTGDIMRWVIMTTIVEVLLVSVALQVRASKEELARPGLAGKLLVLQALQSIPLP